MGPLLFLDGKICEVFMVILPWVLAQCQLESCSKSMPKKEALRKPQQRDLAFRLCPWPRLWKIPDSVHEHGFP